VSPILTDPNRPRPADLVEFRQDSVIPAKPVLSRRMVPDSTRR
jgi:hypothetical protein